jgi:hypothetical protein
MGKVTGGTNGLVSINNINGKKTEALVTVEQLKATWMFGVKIRDRETGEFISDEAYQNALDTAISMMEHYLDISISLVRDHVDYKDYRLNDYQDWGFMMLDNFPVHSITSLKMVYFRDESGVPTTVQEIPPSWIRLNAHDGIIRLIPNTRFPANLQINETGSFFPEILRAGMIPNMWQITYSYGFDSGKVPVLLNQAIAMSAAITLMITAGHLLNLGAGISSASISLDGLSQSINTTNSAENSGFSSTIKDISDKLFGATKGDPTAIMTILKNYYKAADGLTVL